MNERVLVVDDEPSVQEVARAYLGARGVHVELRTPLTGIISRIEAAQDGVLADQAANTGIGLAGDELPHAFERFWRSDKSRSRSRGGAGIGLAICASWCGHTTGASTSAPISIRLPMLRHESAAH